MKFIDFIPIGAANAVTAARIAEGAGLDVRAVRNLVQIERIQGVPICASNEEPFGYFIAESQQELQDYVRSLKRRLRSIYATYIAVSATLDEMTGQERITEFFNDGDAWDE